MPLIRNFLSATDFIMVDFVLQTALKFAADGFIPIAIPYCYRL